MSSELVPLLERFDAYLRDFVKVRYKAAPLGPVMTYALAGQGKRIRPLFCQLAAGACGGTSQIALAPALALEMVHTYSLVHDDLPCMDDDDLRRGRPTTHKEFGEDWAVLAGDGLLTDAFGVIADHCEGEVTAPQRVAMISELASAAGSGGMVGGQAEDIYWTSRTGATKGELDHIHQLKTGALIGAACALGAIAAGASSDTVTRLRSFGQIVGWAFQIRDDLIDGFEGTGKSSGKDVESGKLTYLAVMPREEAERAARQLTDQAIDLVQGMGENGRLLRDLAETLLERTV